MENLSQDVTATADHRQGARAFLDGIERSLLANDFDGYADLFHLPAMLATRKDRFILTERQDLRSGFDLWHRTIQSYKITAIVQSLSTVEAFGPDAAMVTYQTELLSETKLVMPGFTNWVFLRRHGDEWKLEQMVSGVINTKDSHFLSVDPTNANPEI